MGMAVVQSHPKMGSKSLDHLQHQHELHKILKIEHFASGGDLHAAGSQDTIHLSICLSGRVRLDVMTKRFGCSEIS